MRTREEQTAVIRADQQFWRDLAAEVGPDRYGEPGAMGEWTFGDVAGHLLGWRNRTIARLEAAARGQPDPIADEPEGEDEVDAVNVQIRDGDGGRLPAELVDAYTDSYDRLIRAIDALPESMLTDPDALPFAGGPLIDVPSPGISTRSTSPTSAPGSTADERANVKATNVREPESATPLVDGQTETTPWAVAVERLQNPAPGQNHWLATVSPDGRPHLMPIIAFWIDGAFHFLAGEGTRKGRDLAVDDRCVIGTGNLTIPSLDLIVEGHAKPVTDEAEVRRLAAEFGGESWPLEARGSDVYGPHGPTAGPPPYSIYRLEPTKAFGLPGMHGMFDDDRHHEPTRWRFSGD